MSRVRRRGASLVVLSAALALLGVAVAQDASKKADVPTAKSVAADKKTRKGGLLAGGGAVPKRAPRKGADPLAKAQGPADQPDAAPRWPFHFKFKLVGEDGVAVTARFYPSRGGAAAPVLMLVHQGGAVHSGADFEEAIEEARFEGRSLAGHFQEKDYAVLILDRRGHGPGPAAGPQQVVRRDANALVNDLQTGYTFLIDRHNRRELNLAKFGVLAVGDGANLAVLWGATGGAVANEGRASDLAALVLVSPPAEAHNVALTKPLAALSRELPLLVVGGERDTEVFNTIRPIVEAHPGSRVAPPFATRLQAERLLRLEPKAVDQVTKFFEDTVLSRARSEWEPRYLLSRIAYSDIELIQAPEAAEAAKKAAEPAKEPEKAKGGAAASPKR